MKEFKGRVIAKGAFIGEAKVTHEGFNTLASFQKSALLNKKEVKVSDQNNKELYGENITNKILCLPMTIGSTTGGLVIQTVCSMHINPRAFLFSEPIDSLAASGGFGLLVNKMADLRDSGLGIDELYNWVEEHKLEANHWFFPTDLTYLVRGGRVSKASGFFGNMLNICPLLNVDFEGRLIPRAKIRTKKKVIQATADKMLELANNGADDDEDCFINHSDCIEDANALADAIVERMPKLKDKIVINYIGTTIGSHTGPGTVALFFWGKKRVD